MKRFTSMFVLLLFLSFSLSPFIVAHAEAAEDSWTTMAEMPTERSAPGVAAVNGKIYVIGGYGNGYLTINEEYDPATNTWTTKKSMPTIRTSFAIAVYQNKVYVIGGRSGVAGYYGELRCGVNEVYDPATDTWETKASMPTNRSALCANVVDGKIYLIGGLETPVSSGPNVSVLTEVYDPATDSWTTKKPIPTGVYYYASAVVDNKIYVIGGSRRPSAETPNLNQIYDPETDTWSYGKPLPTPVTDAAAGATTGVWAPKRIYVIGGRINYSWDGTNINQVYDPENDSWTVGASMPTARYHLAVAVVNDILYAIGGTPMFNLPLDNYAVNEQYTPFGFGTVPPTISIVSPENKTYTANNVSLTFTVSEPTSWIGYSLDGQANVTITGNTTLTGLSDGSHNLIVYAKDTAGNTGASETIRFNIKTFPTTWIVAAIVIIVIVVAALLVYFAKVKKTTGKVE